MKQQFCTYEISLKLKKLGFNEECLAIYTHNNEHYTAGTFFLHTPHPFTIEELIPEVQDIRESAVYILAPLWQQVIDWFRERHNIIVDWNLHDGDDSKTWRITISHYDCYYLLYNQHVGKESYYETYQEAREQAILKAIELIEQPK